MISVLIAQIVLWAHTRIVDERGDKHQRIRYWSLLALLRSLASSPQAAVQTLRNRTSSIDAETPEEADELGRRTVLDIDTAEENLEKIAIQRWIAAYTDGFEAWAIVRDTGYPAELAAGVSDYDIYSAGTLNGKYPQRMRYGNNEYNTNGAQLDKALQQQGADEQATTLWWAKGE